MQSRWLIIGLVASLALNLFLIGAGAGVIALGVQMARQPPPPPRQVGALFWATEELPQPDRRAMRLMLKDLRDQLRPDTDRSNDLRIAAWGALADPKPDIAAINQKLAQSRQTDIASRARVEQSIVDFASKMPLAERASFAAGMRRVLEPPRAPGPAAAANAAVKAPAKG
jgi:uncharacterized membrane protein